MSKPPKVTKSPPINVKGKNIDQTKADKTLENSKKQTLKDLFNENFTPDQIAEILADPIKSKKILQGFFGNLVSIEKLFTPNSAIDFPTRNMLLGVPGSGLGGGYGGHPIEGYLQFAPSKNSKDIKNLPTPEDPTLKNDPSKPPRVERASSEKFVKVSQQTEAPELKFLNKYKDFNAIATRLVAEIERQNAINNKDQVAFNNIVSKYQKEYTNDLKTFFADTEPGQNILSKITPKR